MTPQERLSDHVTGAIERGEGTAIVGIPETYCKLRVVSTYHHGLPARPLRIVLFRHDPQRHCRGQKHTHRRTTNQSESVTRTKGSDHEHNTRNREVQWMDELRDMELQALDG